MASQVEERIHSCLDDNKNFLLDAGAGSGKTWTLVQSLKYLIKHKGELLQKNNQKIVCITYTKVARDEIIDRTENNNLIIVSTIHEFLWSCIEKYKTELKEKLIEHIDEKIIDIDNVISGLTARAVKTREKEEIKKEKLLEDKQFLIENNKLITYGEYPYYKESIISHDEVILLSEKLFSSYEVIKKILSDSFPYIFIDEYQDTDEKVIKIFLDYLPTNVSSTIGLFGDKMQKIYDTGIGEIPISYSLERIPKEENYRCSISVINLLNKIRVDIQQFPAGDNVQREGDSFFVKRTDESDVKLFINETLTTRWNATEDEIKVLYLTHNLIAKENGYFDLIDLYTKKSNREYLIKNEDNRGCPFSNFLFDVQNIINLYQEGRIQLLLQKIHFTLNSFEDKVLLNEKLLELTAISENKQIHEIIDFVNDNNILKKSEKMIDYDFENEKKKDYFESLMEIPYKQFKLCTVAQKNDTPFTTQHGTKGDEFNNVLVVIDDNAWTQSYNFDKYFSNNDTSERRKEKTKNLFYVVCSRAKNNLAILCLSELSDSSKSKIRELFNETDI